MPKICLRCGRPYEGEGAWHPACVKKMFGTSALPQLATSEEELIDESVGQGKAVTGVQKKFSYSELASKTKRRLTAFSREYIIKTKQENLPHVVLYEWIGMKLAGICGIETVDCGLIERDGDFLFITKRIDREEGKKIPMEDFCQLSGIQTEYKYVGSYERCYRDVIAKYSDYPTVDAIRFFRLLLFSYIIGNTDMHRKNFSLYEQDGKYRLTPSYDLVPVLMVFNQQDMALTLHGKARKMTRNDFIAFGESINIQRPIILKTIHEVCGKKDEMCAFILSTNLPEEEKKRFIQFIIAKIESFEQAPSNPGLA